MRDSNLAYASIVFNVSPIITFYNLNNITLNKKKISRYYGEHIRVVKDRGYSTEEIATILQTADIRMRMIILLLASTGCRVGALPSVNLSNLTFKPEYGLFKIVLYESSNSEYYTFTTRECASAINNYLTFRSRQGERLSFDQNLNRWVPNDIPLIRLTFDINDTLEARNPKRIRLEGLRTALHHHMTSSQYFKPRPGTTYVIQVDLDKHPIKPVENPKFTDAQGKLVKRYELTIVHVNNQKEQIWTISKTVCMQIIEQIRKGFRTLKVTRIGTDRSTTYQIEGVQ